MYRWLRTKRLQRRRGLHLLTRGTPPLRRPKFSPCSFRRRTATRAITLHFPLYILNFSRAAGKRAKRFRRRRERAKGGEQANATDDGVGVGRRGRNVPCAGDFAAASGTDCFRACADSAGLAPDGVYAYAENIRRAQSASREAGASAVGDGRRSRQHWSGSTVEYRPRPKAEPPTAVSRGVRQSPAR